MARFSDLITEYEHQHNVTVVSATVRNGQLADVVSVPIPPDGLRIDVYNMRPDLVRRVNLPDGGWTYESVLRPEAYDNDRVYDWLVRAVERAGGSITWSGTYPCPPLPRWLRKLINPQAAT